MENIDGDRNVLIVVGIKDPDFARRSRVRHTVTVVVINKSSLKDVVAINTTDLLAVVLHDGVDIQAWRTEPTMEYIDGDRNVLIVVGIKDPDFARRSRVRHTVTVVVINKSSLKDVVAINTTDLLAVVLHDGIGGIHKLFDVNFIHHFTEVLVLLLKSTTDIGDSLGLALNDIGVVPTFFNSTILWLIHPWRGRTDIQAQGQDDDVRLDLFLVFVSRSINRGLRHGRHLCAEIERGEPLIHEIFSGMTGLTENGVLEFRFVGVLYQGAKLWIHH